MAAAGFQRKVSHLAVALTGASGMPYALHFLKTLTGLGVRVSLLVSPSAERVLRDETPEGALEEIAAHDLITRLPHKDIGAGIASGSSAPDAMVVIPASMGTLGRIAAGISGNLIERAADVVLKEGRMLIFVPRESPFNRIHLENMLALHDAGAVILPASPGFYHKPETLEDLYRHLTGRLLDRLGIQNDTAPRWNP